MDQQGLQFDIAYPERLSRGLIFIKWLLIIPQLLVLTLLSVGLIVTTFIAWFAILFTGKYPRGLWDFSMMVLRWSARVNAYLYLQRDEYPPFGDADYPVLFQMEYPERLSRGLIFIKWLLIIPHVIVLYILQIIVRLFLIIAWIAILFTGKFPQGMFNFVTGVARWTNRVVVYELLLTDVYPPFSMDPGPSAAANLMAGSPVQRNF
jgi:hypothetical protein